MATQVVECYIGRTGIALAEPRYFNEIWPRCPECKRTVTGEVSLVDKEIFHRDCWRARTVRARG